MTQEELFKQLNAEDTTFYETLIEEINSENLETRNIRIKLEALSSADVSKLSDTQMFILKSMKFYGGYTFSCSYNYDAVFKKRFNAVGSEYGILDNLQNLSKENLIYLSTYVKNQWRKVNPSATRKNVKGTQFEFQMNMFSLTIFQNTITKEFLRTEAKNFVLKVNKAYEESVRHLTHISIRNKFYALILDNTPVHTKALINSLQCTPLELADGKFYEVSEGEALGITIGYANRNLVSMTSSNCIDAYSTDMALVTHSKGVETERDNERMLGAASALFTLFNHTGIQTYQELGTRMLKAVKEPIRNAAITKTESLCQVRETLKSLKENHE